VGGCQSGLQPKGDDLHGVVKRFHHNLRWKYNEDAASRVAPAHSADFRDSLEDLSKDWNVTAWDVRKVEMENEGKRAKIRVHLTHYSLTSPVVQEDKIHEVWELFDDQWILTSWEGGPLKVPADEESDPGQQAKPSEEAPPKKPAEGAVRDLPDARTGD